MDDCATIIGYIKGTEKDADRYVEEYNSACDREWQKVWWEELKKMKDRDKITAGDLHCAGGPEHGYSSQQQDQRREQRQQKPQSVCGTAEQQIVCVLFFAQRQSRG